MRWFGLMEIATAVVTLVVIAQDTTTVLAAGVATIFSMARSASGNVLVSTSQSMEHVSALRLTATAARSTDIGLSEQSWAQQHFYYQALSSQYAYAENTSHQPPAPPPPPPAPAPPAPAPVLSAPQTIIWKRKKVDVHDGILEMMLSSSEMHRQVKEIGIDPRKTCSICLGAELDAMMACGHAIHLQCIGEWRKRRNHCPICRADVGTLIRGFCRECSQTYFEWPILRIGEIVEAKERMTCLECICRL